MNVGEERAFIEEIELWTLEAWRAGIVDMLIEGRAVISGFEREAIYG